MDNVTDLNKIDRRSQRGRELAARLNKQTVLDNMPKLYYVEDGDRVRLGRTDWPGDAFNIIPADEWEVFQRIYTAMSMPLIDLTHDEGDEWDKVRT